MSKTIDFYNNKVLVNETSTYFDIIYDWTDEQWEGCHNFIQLIFPTITPSNFNADAPVLTKEEIDKFHQDMFLQEKLKVSFKRFLQFLGLELKYSWQKRSVEKAGNFPDREQIWLEFNHNWLRITRCLESLKLLSTQHLAECFYECLDRLQAEGYARNSFPYWKVVMEENPSVG